MDYIIIIVTQYSLEMRKKLLYLKIMLLREPTILF